MNDFDYDVWQKKIIARGAHNKKRKTKKCTLPSDYLSIKEKEKLNGEVRLIKMNEPMLWQDFVSMSEDMQAEYLRNLIGKYQCSDHMLGSMFGRTHETVRQRRIDLGVESAGRVALKMTKEEKGAFKKRWEEFLHSGNTSGNTKEKVVDEKESAGPDLTKVEKMNLRITGVESWDELMEIVKLYPFVGTANVSIEFCSKMDGEDC